MTHQSKPNKRRDRLSFVSFKDVVTPKKILEHTTPLRIQPRCIFCHIVFKSVIQLQAHCSSYVHKAPFKLPQELTDKDELEQLNCRVCNSAIYDSTVAEHRCMLQEIESLDELAENYNGNFAPFLCVICKDVPVFASQALLQVHLVLIHTTNKYPYFCGLCNSEFSTNESNLQELHAKDVHCPEINLIAYTLFNERRLRPSKSQVKPSKYHCCLWYYSSPTHTQMVNCQSNIEDLFQLTLHTLCFHGFRALVKYGEKSHIESSDIQPHGELTQNFGVGLKDLKCKHCLAPVDAYQELAEHIHDFHAKELNLRKEFILKTGLFNHKLNLDVTCLYCMQSFDSSPRLQIHMFVQHATKVPFTCGLCERVLFSPNRNAANEIKYNCIDRMQWLAIVYHENEHYEQYIHYFHTKEFVPSLIPPSELYASLEDFENQLLEKQTVYTGPLFTEFQYSYLRKLGKNNYHQQVFFEMNQENLNSI